VSVIMDSLKAFMNKIQIGDPIPSFTLKDQNGNDFDISSFLGGLVPGRVTYVADRSGKVVYIFDSQTETQRHADEALKICLLLKRTDNVNNRSIPS